MNVKKEGAIGKNDKEYPKNLKEISGSPSVLFWRGNSRNIFFHNALGVVGSRRMTSYGKKITEKMVGAFAAQGIVIISGFMYGIDATAHKTAVDADGKTIAVMPCGTDIIHPAYQKILYKEIKKKGLVVSEYENGFPPDKWTYPRRNRIIAGLSDAVLVIEAGEKSGSLITAHLALKYKRKLFAVPGSIFSPVSKGTNYLIKKGLAEPVLCEQDILSFFGKKENPKGKNETIGLTGKEGKILFSLKNEPMNSDEISEKMKMPPAEISAILSVLEIKGAIKKEGLKYYFK